MTQTIVLYRLVGTVDVTFNLMAAPEVDLFQLCQGLEAFEVACSRRARVRGFQHGQLSRKVQLLPWGLTPTDLALRAVLILSSMKAITSELLAPTDVE